VPLYARLSEEVKTAMKAHDAARVETLRFLLSEVKKKNLESHPGDKDSVMTDEEVIGVFQKEAKKRKDSITLFEQGGRADLVEKEKYDLAVIMEYLPAEMPEGDILKIIDEVIAKGAEDFGAVMREVSKLTKGKADGKLVSELVKKKLSS